jgi:hypothetical protein
MALIRQWALRGGTPQQGAAGGHRIAKGMQVRNMNEARNGKTKVGVMGHIHAHPIELGHGVDRQPKHGIVSDRHWHANHLEHALSIHPVMI